MIRYLTAIFAFAAAAASCGNPSSSQVPDDAFFFVGAHLDADFCGIACVNCNRTCCASDAGPLGCIACLEVNCVHPCGKLFEPCCTNDDGGIYCDTELVCGGSGRPDVCAPGSIPDASASCDDAGARDGSSSDSD